MSVVSAVTWRQGNGALALPVAGGMAFLLQEMTKVPSRDKGCKPAITRAVDAPTTWSHFVPGASAFKVRLLGTSVNFLLSGKKALSCLSLLVWLLSIAPKQHCCQNKARQAEQLKRPSTLLISAGLTCKGKECQQGHTYPEGTRECCKHSLASGTFLVYGHTAPISTSCFSWVQILAPKTPFWQTHSSYRIADPTYSRGALIFT